MYAGALLSVACEDSIGEKAPALTIPQVRRLLEVILPLKRFTLEEVLRVVKRTQERNHTAYLTHRKQRDESG